MTAGLETFAKVRALHDRTTSPGEKAAAAARLQVLARKAGLTVEQAVSRLDMPKPTPPSQATSESFADFMKRPEFTAERHRREARRRAEAAAIVEQHGSEEALFADTPIEAALRAACAPLLGSDETWRTIHHLDGWGTLASRDRMPASVRAAVSRAWPMPETVAAVWAEFAATDRLTSARYTVDSFCDPHLFVQARQHLLEELLNTLPARNIHDMRARLDWMDHIADGEVSSDPKDDRIRLATLRADIDRMGERVPGQDPAPIQNGQGADGDRLKPQPVSNARAEYPRRPTRSERHAAVLALVAEGHADREVARRLGLSPTTVGNIKRKVQEDGR